MTKKILFMGTPDFSVPILEALVQSDYQVVGVVTQPDRLVGRKKLLTASPVKQAALAHGLPVYQPEKLTGSDQLKAILAQPLDLIVTAAYGQFLPERLLNHPKYRSINVHASLLPKYRGGAPIQYALMNGDEKTGVSIMYMEKKMDAGAILSQAELLIQEEDNVSSLFDKLSLLGRDLLMQTLPDLFEGRLEAQEQDEGLVTFSPALKREEEVIDWHKTARDIHNQIRAMNAWPGAYSLLGGNRFKIWVSQPLEEASSAEPGTIIRLAKDCLLVACGQGTVLSLKEVQPAGKSKMTISDYMKGLGARLQEGERFGN